LEVLTSVCPNCNADAKRHRRRAEYDVFLNAYVKLKPLTGEKFKLSLLTQHFYCKKTKMYNREELHIAYELIYRWFKEQKDLKKRVSIKDGYIVVDFNFPYKVDVLKIKVDDYDLDTLCISFTGNKNLIAIYGNFKTQRIIEHPDQLGFDMLVPKPDLSPKLNLIWAPLRKARN
jgi:hypothetical protein